MKKILFLLLFTIASYGQAVFDEGIQITGNANSATATKVNVQEANGKVNTQTINTGFNKNIGLGGSDVVGANTLLNQYSTTPLDWTATAFNSGQVVFYAGKQWISKIATVAGDVPSVSSKWEEITFEALANKSVIVDATPTYGSNNAVSSNGVFDALATKAPISSVHNPVTLGMANGLSLSTQQLSLGLASSSTTGALSGTDWNTFNGKFNTPTGLTTNYLPKWNGSGFVNSILRNSSGRLFNGMDDGVNTFQFTGSTRIISGNLNIDPDLALVWGATGATNFAQSYYSAVSKKLIFTKSNGVNTLEIEDYSGNVNVPFNLSATTYTGGATLTGTPTAPTAPAGTNTTQVATTAFVQAIARPYKVYTALLSQTGTNAPTIIVLENTLGATISMTRQSTGHYRTTISTGNFPANRTFKFIQNGNYTITKQQILTAAVQINTVAFDMYTEVDGVKADDVLMNAAYEIRIYP